MVTIEGVAEKAGVSVATVSRVINNESMVTKDKVERVKAAMSEINYHPNTLRKKKEKGAAKTVLVVTSDVIDDILKGISDAAKTRDYNVMLDYVTSNDVNTKNIQQYFEKGIVDGAILINYFASPKEIASINELYPLVQCGETTYAHNSFSVSIDDERAAYDLTTYLIQNNKRRIAFSAFDFDVNFSKRRIVGYQRALYENDIPYDPTLLFTTEHSVEGGTEIAAKVLADGYPPLDAIVCASNLVAEGFLHALRKVGGKDRPPIVVAGFDNVESSELIAPQIVTVSQPFFQIGYEAMRMLYSLIHSEIKENQRVYLPYEIIVPQDMK